MNQSTVYLGVQRRRERGEVARTECLIRSLHEFRRLGAVYREKYRIGIPRYAILAVCLSVTIGEKIHDGTHTKLTKTQHVSV
jgi:hypothetical protein